MDLGELLPAVLSQIAWLVEGERKDRKSGDTKCGGAGAVLALPEQGDIGRT